MALHVCRSLISDPQKSIFIFLSSKYQRLILFDDYISAPKSDDPKPEYVTVSTSRTPSASTNNTASVDYVGGIRPPGSPFNTSSSGKGSIASSNLGSSSTFKSLVNGDAVSTPAAAPVTLPQQQPPMGRLELKLPVQHRVNFDTGCDQGYGSERSPEEEVPPTLPSLANGGVDSFNFINGPPALMLMGQPPATAAVSAPATSTTTAHEAGLPTGQMTTDEDRLDCEYEFITKGKGSAEGAADLFNCGQIVQMQSYSNNYMKWRPS